MTEGRTASTLRAHPFSATQTRIRRARSLANLARVQQIQARLDAELIAQLRARIEARA